MRKLGPGKAVDLEDVVQEFDQIEGPLAHLTDLRRLLDRRQMAANLMGAAPEGATM